MYYARFGLARLEYIQKQTAYGDPEIRAGDPATPSDLVKPKLEPGAIWARHFHSSVRVGVLKDALQQGARLIQRT